MGSWSSRQLAAIGAVVAVVIMLVGFLMPGSPPHFNADTLKIVAFFHDKHKKLLVSTVLIEIGAAILVYLIAQLAMSLRAMGMHAHGAIIGIAGAAAVGAFAVGDGLMGGLAQLSTFGTYDQAAVSPLYRLVQFVFIGFAWMFFVVALTTAHAAWKGGIQWVAALNGIIAVLALLTGISVKAQGPFAAGTGALSLIGSFAFLVWILHLAVMFWRGQEAPAAAMAHG